MRVTAAPPEGAGPLRVTVPVEFVPPLTLVGFRLIDESVGAFTVRTADAVPEALMVADVFAATALVVTVNLAVVAPAATVTLAGT